MRSNDFEPCDWQYGGLDLRNTLLTWDMYSSTVILFTVLCQYAQNCTHTNIDFSLFEKRKYKISLALLNQHLKVDSFDMTNLSKYRMEAEKVLI
jgi:hypothetical protein